MPFKRNLYNFFLIGAFFGLLFPIGAIFILLVPSNEWTLQQLLIIQNERSLLWIIETAPLFLGISGALTGHLFDQKEQYHKQKSQLNQIKECLTILLFKAKIN